MAKKVMPKGRKFVEEDEKYNDKIMKKTEKGERSSGIAKSLKKSEKEEGYSKMPKVKPQKKTKGLVR